MRHAAYNKKVPHQSLKIFVVDKQNVDNLPSSRAHAVRYFSIVEEAYQWVKDNKYWTVELMEKIGEMERNAASGAWIFRSKTPPPRNPLQALLGSPYVLLDDPLFNASDGHAGKLLALSKLAGFFASSFDDGNEIFEKYRSAHPQYDHLWNQAAEMGGRKLNAGFSKVADPVLNDLYRDSADLALLAPFYGDRYEAPMDAAYGSELFFGRLSRFLLAASPGTVKGDTILAVLNACPPFNDMSTISLLVRVALRTEGTVRDTLEQRVLNEATQLRDRIATGATSERCFYGLSNPEQPHEKEMDDLRFLAGLIDARKDQCEGWTSSDAIIAGFAEKAKEIGELSDPTQAKRNMLFEHTSPPLTAKIKSDDPVKP